MFTIYNNLVVIMIVFTTNLKRENLFNVFNLLLFINWYREVLLTYYYNIVMTVVCFFFRPTIN